MVNENHSNRPADTAFKQQKLKSWQPILTPKKVIPIFFVIGILFLPIGIGLFLTSESINEIILDYTECKYKQKPPVPIRSWSYSDENKQCTLDFNIFEKFEKPVYMYYRLTSFYQNHRLYIKSYDADQLGSTKRLPPSQLNSNCDPIRAIEQDRQYYPCGLIANSFFSDIFSNLINSEGNEYEFSERGISWSSDKSKYKSIDVEKLADNEISLFVPPPNWVKVFPQYANGYTKENFPRISEMERFQVWMRVSGLPNFRKLYGQNTEADLSTGVYTIVVNDTFDVESFGGTKAIVISNVSAFGGKNPFLGIGYMVVGGISLIFGVIFLIRNMVKPRKLGDTSYLSYKQS